MLAPPALRVIMRFAVSVVTWRHAARVVPFRGFFFAKFSFTFRRTGMSSSAHSILFLPIWLKPIFFTWKSIFPPQFVFFQCPYKRMTLAGCAKVIPERLKIDNSGDDAGGLPQGLGLVRKLPVEPGLFPAEVAVGGRLPVYGSQELQVLYELRGLHAEVRLHELLYLLYRYLLCAAGVDHDRDRLRHAYH